MGSLVGFPSKAPHRQYATTLDEQLRQLESDELMLRSPDAWQMRSIYT